jgi:hypothetical protein
VMSITALVVVGNQDGVIGYGKGKAFEAEVAVDKVKAAVYLMPMRRIHQMKSSPHLNWPLPSCLWSYCLWAGPLRATAASALPLSCAMDVDLLLIRQVS